MKTGPRCLKWPLTLWLVIFLSVLVVSGCSVVDRPDPSGDPEGDGVISREDNCPLAANPEQYDADGDGFGDACDLLVASLGQGESGQPPKVTARYFAKLPQRPPGIFTLVNASDTPRQWTMRMDPQVPWLTFNKTGQVAPQSVSTVAAKILPSALGDSEIYKTRLWFNELEGGEYFTDFELYIVPVLPADQCVYTVTLTRFTVMARQGLLQEGLALEPFADLNAVGLRRIRNPLVGTHVLRAGQSVFPNAIIGVGQDQKGNQVNVQVIADVDEIDGFPNPDDLRQQGQSGVANFQFICDYGSQIQVIPVNVIGNIPGEGNGAVELEITVDWDP